MPFFQNSVLNKHLKTQDAETVETAYQEFTSYFHNPAIQQNIRDAKEEQFQEGFLRELFVNILGYKLNPQPAYNLTTELKNEKGSKKCDGAIIDSSGLQPTAVAVIELKGTNTKDLEKINEQAFNYKNNQRGCIYVITSNFEKLRFFIHNTVEHLEFNLFTLTLDEFRILWLCLHVDNLLSSIPLKVKEESLLAEENITKQLYKDYSSFKSDLWKNMSKNHEHHDQLMLFKKTQKLLDRFLFIFFAEDSGLLPPNSISKIIDKWKQDKDWGEDKKLYDIYKQYFGFINSGRPARGDRAEIFGYNGGLFQDDLILDNINIDDDILLKHTEKLTAYDFQSEVDVNILGHIFENSLNEIESITAELEGQEVNKSKSKRKRDGVFYTPKYITKYIVDNTVGKLCEEKKAELNITDERFGQASKRTKKGIADLKAYKGWLLDLKICDPACGSGAFLNQALEFLIDEHRYLDELTAQYHKSPLVLSDIETQILEQNIYGVDINEESVEIAKLSLWLRTAQKGRKLTSLNNNIKCGNSLIDDPAVAGEKAFNWQKEFPETFIKKEKRAWHLTWATHDTRTSKRMIKYKVRERRADGEMHVDRSIILEENEAIKVTEFISQIVLDDKLNCLAYAICNDHVHMALVCEEDELDNTVRKLKGKSAQKFKEFRGIPKDETFHLWARKYNKTPITSDEQLYATIKYIKNNRQKHELPDINDGLQPIVNKMICEIPHAFRVEYKGGFDVVIGNPPWGAKTHKEELDYIKSVHKDIIVRMVDSFMFFVDKSIDIIKKNGCFGLITPDVILYQKDNEKLRKKILEVTNLTHSLNLGDGIFENVARPSAIIISNKNKAYQKTLVANFDKRYDSDFFSIRFEEINPSLFQTLPSTTFATRNIRGYDLLNRLSSNLLEDYVDEDGIQRGISPDLKQAFIVDSKTIAEKGLENFKIHKTVTGGVDVKKYFIKDNDKHILYVGKKDNPDAIQNIINHVAEFRDKITCTEVKQGKHPFYSLHRTRDEKIFAKSEKILGVITGDRIITAIDTGKIYPTDGLYLFSAKKKYSNKSLSTILNSTLITFLYRLISSESNRTMAQVKPVLVSKIPIILQDNESNQKLIEYYDHQNANYTKLTRLTNKLIQYLKTTLKIEPSSKIQSWYELDFGYFINELNKTIKKAGGERLSKSDEMEWMEVFEIKKAEAQELKAEIDKTDKEIDQLVYELYGLTEEEIKIVEQLKA